MSFMRLVCLVICFTSFTYPKNAQITELPPINPEEYFPNEYDYPYMDTPVCDPRQCDVEIPDGCTESDDYGFAARNSTSYVAWFINQILINAGIIDELDTNTNGGLGDSQNWAEQLHGLYDISTVPMIGSIAFFDKQNADEYGALGIVYNVNEDDCSVDIYTMNFDCNFIGTFAKLQRVYPDAFLRHPDFTPAVQEADDIHFVTEPRLKDTAKPQFDIWQDEFIIQNYSDNTYDNLTITVSLIKEGGGTEIELYRVEEFDIAPEEEITIEFTSYALNDAPLGTYEYLITFEESGGTSINVGRLCDRPFFVEIIDNTLFDTDIVELLAPGTRYEDPIREISTVKPNFRYRVVNLGVTYTIVLENISTGEQFTGIVPSNPPVFNLPIDFSLDFETKYKWWIEATLEDGTMTTSIPFYFKTPPEFFPNCDITDVDAVTDPALHEAVESLCALGIITPEYISPENSFGVLPDAPIIRKDAAIYTTYGLFGGFYELPEILYTDNYPVPYYDLTRGYDFQRFGKFMSYLSYENEVMAATPFGGIYYNFRPFQEMTEYELLKAIVEAFNVHVVVYNEVGYEIAAGNSGILPQGGTINGSEIATRRQLYTWLHRAMTETPVEITELAKPENFDFPSHYTYANMRTRPVESDGSFNYAEANVFNIPNRTMGFSLDLRYASEATKIPDEYYDCHPFREKGWTHNFCSYIKEVEGWSAGGWDIPNHLLYYPPGSLYPDIWRIQDVGGTPIAIAETDGLNYTLDISDDEETITIELLNKKILTFNKQTDNADVWWWEHIEDFNGVYLTLSYESFDNNHPEHQRLVEVNGSVTGIPNWKLDFVFSNDAPDRISQICGPHPDDINQQRCIGTNYDSDGRFFQFVDLGLEENQPSITEYIYGNDKERLLIKGVKLPRGNIVDNEYESRKLRSSRILSNNSPLQEVSIDQTYNALSGSFQTTITTQDNDSYTSNRNSTGYPTYYSSKLTNGDLSEVTLGYSNSGRFPQMPSEIDYEGIEMVVKRNDKGQETSLEIPSVGIKLENIYTDENFLETYRRWCRGEWQEMHVRYDNGEYGNATEIIDFEGHSYYAEYNDYGQPTSTENPMGIKSYTFYNPTTGLVDSVQNALSETLGFFHDFAGRPTHVTDAVSNTNFVNYYFNDLPRNFIDADSDTTKYSYDANFNLSAIENSLNNATTFEHDPETDQLTSMTFGQSTESIQYTETGLIESVTKADGYVFPYTYNENNDFFVSDGYLEYTYEQTAGRDRINEVSVIHQPGNFISYDEYDAIDRPKQYTQSYPEAIDGGTYTVSYEYDENGNITKTIYPGGEYEVNNFYDKNDRLIRVEDNQGNVIQYIRRDDGLTERVILPNGYEKYYTYDEAGRLKNVRWIRSTDITPFLLFDIERERRGLNESETYNDLFPGTVPPPISIDFVHDDQNQITKRIDLLTGEEFPFAYDPNGNCTRNHQFLMSYTDYDQLEHMDALDSSYSAEFYYGPNGKRIAARRNNTEVTRYWWDHSGMGYPIAESKVNGEDAKYYYLYGTELLARINADDPSEVHFYLDDYRGNIVAMTDGEGNITHKYEYDAYGNILNLEEADYNPFRFMGSYGVMHEIHNLYYVRARYLDSENFVFLQEDPIWAENLYTYARGNPVNFTDPSGEFVPLLVIGAVILIEAAAQTALDAALDEGIEALGGPEATWKTHATSFGLNLIPGVGELNTVRKGVNLVDTAIDIKKANNVAKTIKKDEILSLPAPKKIHNHHVFPQQHRKWFESKGIGIDDWTVPVSQTGHLKGIHGNGYGHMPGKWNDKWSVYIKNNPNANASEVFHFGEGMRQMYGLEYLKYRPWK